MRNMFYTVTVASAEPIDGCDKIHYIGFEENGYKVIASKEIKIGDVVAYGEVDSIFPESDKRFEFLKARCYKESLNGYLIKAMKMRGLRSFGIVFTFNELGIKPVKAGTDLTDKFNIGKYEPAEDASPKMQKAKGLKGLLFKFKITRPLAYKIFGVHKIKGEFPTHIISKSDEDNIQNHKEWFDKYKNEPCYISAKIEGCVSEDTIVITENGEKTIKEIYDTQYNGKVLSYNEQKEALEMKEIISASKKPTDKNTIWYELETDEGTKLKITGNDKLYLPKLKCYRTVDDIFKMEELPEILLN